MDRASSAGAAKGDPWPRVTRRCSNGTDPRRPLSSARSPRAGTRCSGSRTRPARGIPGRLRPRPTSPSSAAATPGCGPRCWPSVATRARTWCCSRRPPSGGRPRAATVGSARRASRTARPTAADAGPRSTTRSSGSARRTSTPWSPTWPSWAWTSSWSGPASSRWPWSRTRSPGRGRPARGSSTPSRPGPGSTHRTRWPASSTPRAPRWCTLRVWSMSWPGSPPSSGSRSTSTAAWSRSTAVARRRCRCAPRTDR